MVIRTTLEERGAITKEEIMLLKKADKMSSLFDEEISELTEKELNEFYRVRDEDR